MNGQYDAFGSPPCPCGDMTVDDCAGECGRLIKDGYEAPPPTHRDGPDTEQEAADKVAPVAKIMRERCRDLAFRAGAAGVIGMEACEAFGMVNHQSTVRTRLGELCDEKHGAVLAATATRRKNSRGNKEQVYVATMFL